MSQTSSVQQTYASVVNSNEQKEFKEQKDNNDVSNNVQNNGSNNLDIFIRPASMDECIIAIDASGSTTSKFYDRTQPQPPNAMTVFAKQCELAQNLPHKKFRLIVWGSMSEHQYFKNTGYYIPSMNPMDINELRQWCRILCSSLEAFGCSTQTHLAFEGVPQQWLKSDIPFYLITDGQIDSRANHKNYNRSTDMPTVLAEQIREKVSRYNIQLNIIAVDCRVVDLSKAENLQDAAGCDVYNIIKQSRLTSSVCSFTSYTLSGTYTQISKIRPPAGFIPYGDRYFLEANMPQFISYLQATLQNANENEQINIIQRLSVTLTYLTKDKPVRQRNAIIQQMSTLFTLLAPSIVTSQLTDLVNQELDGTAGMLANIRQNLKNLFAEAGRLLIADTRKAIGLNERFVTVPINGRVLVGPSRLITEPSYVCGNKYNNSAYNGNLPAFPLNSNADIITEMKTDNAILTDQCLRQWLRAVYGSMFNLNVTDDELIYIVLGINLIIHRSNISQVVKTSFRQMAFCMLRKKRLNSIDSELSRIMRGDSPTPNSGKLEDLYKYLNNVATKLGFKCQAMRLWYEMCGALSSDIQKAQVIHCEKSNLFANEFTYSTYDEDIIPSEFMYDYDWNGDIDEKDGGYVILPHNNGSCVPPFVLSEAFYNNYKAKGSFVCLQCYKQLTEQDFKPVGPQKLFVLPDSYKHDFFKANANAQHLQPNQAYINNRGRGAGWNRGGRGGRGADQGRGGQVQQNQGQQNQGQPKNQPAKSYEPYCSNKGTQGFGTLVALRGTVGAGKTTYAEALAQYVRSYGGTAYIEGTDQYCKTGSHIKDAVNTVMNNLSRLVHLKSRNVWDNVVIVDTCGSMYPDSTKYFNVDFNRWRIITVTPNYIDGHLDGYLAWSLRNVLSRGKVTNQCNFYLTPESQYTPPAKCIEIHSKKASTVFRDASKYDFSRDTVATLQDRATAYESLLKAFDFSYIKNLNL